MDRDDWNDVHRLQLEKETLGHYITGHPLQAVESELKHLITAFLGELKLKNQSRVTIAGIITALKTLSTRSGKRMAIVSLEDRTGRMDVTVFSDLYQKIRDELTEDKIFVVRGEMSKDDFSGGVKVMAETMNSLDNIRQKMAKRLVIHVGNHHVNDQWLPTLADILKPYCGGTCDVIVGYQGTEARAKIQLGKEWQVRLEGKLLDKINQLYGREAAVVEYT